MPILSSAVFDNTGKVYDVSRILTPDFRFDNEAYQSYSRVFLPITYVLSYALQFASLAALLTHTACWHGKDIWRQWRRTLKEVESKTEATYEPIGDSTGSSTTSLRMPSNLRRIRSGSRRRSLSESILDSIMSQEDVHSRLMRRYNDVPISWYLITFFSMTAVGIFVVE